MGHDQHKESVDLSIVIPVFNEEDNVIPLTEDVLKQINKLSLSVEVIFVDDGSRDKTFPRLVETFGKRPGITLVRLRRNFGKSAALMEGFKRARGRIVITMDGDRQDDPAEIPNFLNMLAEGYDIVSGWKKRRHDPLSKTVPSKVFNAVTSLFAGLRLHDFNCGFKAYRREVIGHLVVYGELYRYIPVIAHWKGFRVGEMEVMHHPRVAGKSKYGVGRYFKGFVDFMTILFLTKYAKRPLHFFGSIGLTLFTLGLGIELYLTYLWFFRGMIGWRPILFLGILLIMAGIQITTTGLIGELLYNMHSREEHTDFAGEVIGGGTLGGPVR